MLTNDQLEVLWHSTDSIFTENTWYLLLKRVWNLLIWDCSQISQGPMSYVVVAAASCEFCRRVGIKHAFYSKSKRFCSLACSRSFSASAKENKVQRKSSTENNSVSTTLRKIVKSVELDVWPLLVAMITIVVPSQSRQDNTTHLKIGYPSMKSMGIWSSNEFQNLVCVTSISDRYYCSSAAGTTVRYERDIQSVTSVK